MKDGGVVLMGVDDRPLLDRPELDPLIDAAGIKLLAIDEEAEFLPMAGSICLRRGCRKGHRTTVGDFGFLDGLQWRGGRISRQPSLPPPPSHHHPPPRARRPGGPPPVTCPASRAGARGAPPRPPAHAPAPRPQTPAA